jgi:hypothetical protein
MYFLAIMPSRSLKSHVGRTPGRIFSKFFTLGQVIETVRGGGIFQPAIDEAIKKLQAGDWVSTGPWYVVHYLRCSCFQYFLLGGTFRSTSSRKEGSTRSRCILQAD